MPSVRRWARSPSWMSMYFAVFFCRRLIPVVGMLLFIKGISIQRLWRGALVAAVIAAVLAVPLARPYLAAQARKGEREHRRRHRIQREAQRLHKPEHAQPHTGLALSVGPRERRRVPRRRAHRARRHRILAERLTPALPEGMPATGAVRLIEHAPRCRNRSPKSSTGSRPSTASAGPCRPTVLAAAATGALAQRRARGHPDPQGQGERGRSPSRAPCTSRSVTTATCRCSTSPCRPNPAVPDRVRCSTPSTRSSASASPSTASLRTSQWIERGGARLEPLAADAFAPVLEASAS